MFSSACVFGSAGSAEMPWWAIVGTWPVSLIPALLFWTKHGREIEI
jgi:hypothetical protein